MDNYIPDMYYKSIYTVDYGKLLNRGIKCILFDLDNTVVPVNMKIPNKKIKTLFNELKEKGFKVIIFSNSPKRRLKPFKDELDVDCSASSKKPFKKKYLQVMNMYGFSVNEVAIVGDQLVTDILGGNKIGITTILVNPISTNDIFITKVLRVLEGLIMKRLRKRDLFVKGRYYE